MTKNMIAVLGALAGFAAAAAVHAETVTVNGSTTVLPAMQLTAEGFMKANPNITVTISGTGSGNGIKALRDGMTDVAMASRDMKDKEVKDFADHNIKTVRYTVAHDAIIPVVNPNNAVKGLTWLSSRTSSLARSVPGMKSAVPRLRSLWLAATLLPAPLSASRNW